MCWQNYKNIEKYVSIIDRICSPPVKKVCGPQKGCSEKRCANTYDKMYNNNNLWCSFHISLGFGTKFTWIRTFAISLPSHNHFLAAILDFTSLFTSLFEVHAILYKSSSRGLKVDTIAKLSTGCFSFQLTFALDDFQPIWILHWMTLNPAKLWIGWNWTVYWMTVYWMTFNLAELISNSISWAVVLKLIIDFYSQIRSHNFDTGWFGVISPPKALLQRLLHIDAEF